MSTHCSLSGATTEGATTPAPGNVRRSKYLSKGLTKDQLISTGQKVLKLFQLPTVTIAAMQDEQH